MLLLYRVNNSGGQCRNVMLLFQSHGGDFLSLFLHLEEVLVAKTTAACN